jgi:hypothetical protein
MNHTLKMLIGCLVPLALIFILPLFGVGSGLTLTAFIVLMFFCHVMMMGGHNHERPRQHEHREANLEVRRSDQSKEIKNE